ncbi:hypothetical protein, partial [Bradyrhizobium yuanmingense]|uniref:hypothetical protein n=1 Tax=Bradyrhizobium yuanmingense TaxID=108015 RepID=UPI001AEBEF69
KGVNIRSRDTPRKVSSGEKEMLMPIDPHAHERARLMAREEPPLGVNETPNRRGTCAPERGLLGHARLSALCL